MIYGNSLLRILHHTDAPLTIGHKYSIIRRFFKAGKQRILRKAYIVSTSLARLDVSFIRKQTIRMLNRDQTHSLFIRKRPLGWKLTVIRIYARHDILSEFFIKLHINRFFILCHISFHPYHINHQSIHETPFISSQITSDSFFCLKYRSR